ncbi:MAG: ABC transporter ATP-binding protein/permease [Caldilineaceae bacterium]|nr:ABC transporter ATP-binding protein/permease [Caldilineaceae bacterium]HRJ41031.1 ABC transporter ATP-binding protein [Caldilineaceae bacterium]
MARREFTIANEFQYDTRSPLRWLSSHILRYALLLVVFFATTAGMGATQSMAAVLVGRAFDTVVEGAGSRALTVAALWVVAAYVGFGLFDIVNSLVIRVLAQRVERDARDELYLSLLSKSQTYHGRQRVGDLMARVTNDVQQTNQFVFPALGLTTESVFMLLIPLITIATLDPKLLLVPILFLAGLTIALRQHNQLLRPVAGRLRERFGLMNAGLAEAITGIEVVKGFAQEAAEEGRFRTGARSFRDAFVQEGDINARYLPLLLYGIAIGLGFGHALLLYRQGAISVGQIITFMALLGTLRSPVRFLLMTSSAIQQSFASARRILTTILTETELDQNSAGLSKRMDGDVIFEGVSFGYEAAEGESAEDAGLALNDISFHAAPGQTIAIVGQTGAGKSTLTKLLNRTFDTSAGRVLIDGVDVRAWSLESLRGQIATIEQDIFLFSRTIAENIAFGAQADVTQAQIEAAAQEAQAHDFIASFPEGYKTVIGERGVMLSGGQRQRLAIARAFLSDPRILVLDDSTSAIDSNTEDQIQQAMRRILAGRTTFLITHRLSLIRSADYILLMKNGRLIAQGSHDDLLATSAAYRQVFAPVER